MKKFIFILFVGCLNMVKAQVPYHVIIIPPDSSNHNFIYCAATPYQFIIEGIWYQPCDWYSTPTTPTILVSAVGPPYSAIITFPTAGTYTIDVGCTDQWSGTNNEFGQMVINVTCATGIEEATTINKELNIYPNPSNGSFIIEPNSATKRTIQIYDVNGKLVLTQTVDGKTSIDATHLNEGVYSINIISSEGIMRKYMVIVR